MKKTLFGLFILTAMVMCSSATIAEAEMFNYDKMYTKAKRGTINILSSPLEIPKQIKAELKKSEDSVPAKIATAMGGTVKGIAYTVGRAGSGLWDLVTFNINMPRDYGALMQPEYVCPTCSLK